MTQNRDEHITLKNNSDAKTIVLLPKDVWYGCILPRLDKKALHQFALSSQEARQLVNGFRFTQKSFAKWVDDEIARLTIVTQSRYPVHGTPEEVVLSAALGGHLSARGMRLVQLVYLYLFLLSTTKAIRRPNKVLVFLCLATAVGFSCSELVFRNENQEAIQRDQSESKRQEELHHKKYALTYLRDELPTGQITTHRLFAKPKDQAREFKTVDKRDLYYRETFFSKYKCLANEFLEEYRLHRKRQ